MGTVRMATLVWLACSSAATSAASAQILWDGTRYGMTVEEVKTAVPAAIVPTRPDRLHNGAVELLRRDDVKILGHDFRASFFFLHNRLDEVMLSLKNPGRFGAAMLVFESLSDALRARYGRELSRSVERHPLNRAQAAWIAGRTDIAMLVFAIGDNEAVLTITYGIRLAASKDTL